MIKKLIGVLVTLSLVLCLFATPVFAASPTALTAVGDSPREARIVIDMPAGTTLGAIESISWSEYLVNGYAPHVDVFMDTDGNGSADDALVFEYAYNNDTHYAESHTTTEAFGNLTGVWSNVFSDDGNGPGAVTSTSFAWLSSGAPGPYPPIPGFTNGFYGGTLTEWCAGAVVPTIDTNTVVVKVEIEVDSWVKDTTALVKDISIVVSGSSVELSAVIGDEVLEPDIVAVSVDTGLLDFGTVYPGTPSAIETVTVTNVGTVSADVEAVVTGDTVFTSFLIVDPMTFTLGIGDSMAVGAQLNIPETYVPRGAESGTITFEVIASP